MIDVSAIGGSSCAHDAKANSIFCSPALSLMLQLSSELQHRVVCCPGFLHTATLSYIRLLQIYLDGLELKAASQLSKNQVTENSDGSSFCTRGIWLTRCLNCRLSLFRF